MRTSKQQFMLALAVALPNLASGVTIYFDTTSSAGWYATGGGAVNATPYVTPDNFGGTGITVTSTANDSGTFMQGGSVANFNGYWTAMHSFTLPANAANVQLSYTHYSADDRGVLMLNGNMIDSVGLPVNGQFTGSMVFTDGGALQPFTFNGGPTKTGLVTTGFILGGVNTIQGIMNNTGNGVVGPLTHLAWNDGTGFGIYATLTYDIVPEPSVAALAVLGLGCLLGFRNRRA